MSSFPRMLRSIGVQKSAGGTVDPNGIIPLVRGILELSLKYDFDRIGPAVKQSVSQHLVGSSAALSSLLRRVRSSCAMPKPPDLQNWSSDAIRDYFKPKRLSLLQWQESVKRLLALAHEHKIHTMLPGLYFLLLSLHGPAELAVNTSFSLSDRARCTTAFPFIHRDICKHHPSSNQDALDHRTLWAFCLLTNNAQEEIWASLPSAFKFKNWKQLEYENLNTTLR